MFRRADLVSDPHGRFPVGNQDDVRTQGKPLKDHISQNIFLLSLTVPISRLSIIIFFALIVSLY